MNAINEYMVIKVRKVTCMSATVSRREGERKKELGLKG